MGTGVIFALLSMLFAGLNDVVFKKYSSKERSRGMLVLGIGFTWAISQILFMLVKQVPFSPDSNTLTYGLIAGILVAASNILLIEGLSQIDVSLGSTMYRLNTIGVVFLSFIFLGESIELLKGSGIVLGVISVLLMNAGNQTSKPSKRTAVFFWLVVFASLFRAGFGVVSKAGLSANAQPQSLLLLAALCWIAGGAFYAKFIEKHFSVTKDMLVYSLGSGLLVFCIANFLILGLEVEQAVIVVPIANMSFIVAFALSLALKIEGLNLRKTTATCLAAASIFLLAKP